MYDIIIIGCGITGAACAYTLSRYDLKIVVLEASDDIANGATKANSAIIHAGYDPVPGSLISRLNVKGCAMAHDICRRLSVPYRQTGSMVLAFSDVDMSHLRALYERGAANGVPGMRILHRDEALAIEPELSDAVVGALLAPSAGIVNPWEYAIAMAETAVKNGTEIFRNAKVSGIEKRGHVYTVQTARGNFEGRYVLNAAGVNAAVIHSMLEKPDYEIIPTRGQYYLLDKCEGGRASHVIFQCPSEKGKGVLVAPTVHGNLIVGPDAERTAPDDVSVTAEGLAAIAEKAKLSIPTIDFKQNIRNFAGVRANTDKDDFIIGESKDFPGFFDIAGIRSPGLTAAPAVGRYVAELLSLAGLPLVRKSHFIDERKHIRFAELSEDEKNALISKNTAYGRVICRCETITEGEIVAALNSPIPPLSINGVKRRCGAGMGRCQGGFCSPKVHELISRELRIPFAQVCLEDEGSYIVAEETKKPRGSGEI